MTDISTTLNAYLTTLNGLDSSPKTIILQPGEYVINANIDFTILNILGIRGLNKFDTKISISAKLLDVEFLENLTLNILDTDSIDILVSAKTNSNSSYVKDLILNQIYFGDNFYCFNSFMSLENITAYNIVGFAEQSKNLNNIKISNTNVGFIDNINTYLLYNCSNINNIDIDYIDFEKSIIMECSNINNSNIQITDNLLLKVFDTCKNITNFNIGKVLAGFGKCNNVSNGDLNSTKNPFDNTHKINNINVVDCVNGAVDCSLISNVQIDTAGNFGFTASIKISNSCVINSSIAFNSCFGLNNNYNANNTQNYVNSFADLAGIYLPFDTFAGGFNA